MKNKKNVYLLIVFAILLLPNVVFASTTVHVRRGVGMSQTNVADIVVDDNATVADVKTSLQNDYSIDFNENVLIDGSMNEISPYEEICGSEVTCYGPDNAKEATIEIATINHTLTSIELDSIPPTSDTMMESIAETNYEIFEAYGMSYKKSNSTYTLFTCVNFMSRTIYDNVHITFNYDPEIKALAEQIISTGLLTKNHFEATDTELLHKINYGGSLASYTSEFKNQVSNVNFTFELDQRGGAFEPFATEEIGFYRFMYDGVLYGIKDFMEVVGNHVIYVPSDSSDIVNAIRARLTTLFGDENNLTVAVSDDTINEMLATYGEDPVSDGNQVYYIITNTDTSEEYFFRVVKDSSKINNSVPFKSKDLITNVSVETDEKIPLDTKVLVDNITSGTLHDNIFTFLELEDGEIYSIDLFSESQNIPVTTLANGNFLVSIPVPERFSGKTLIIYYINDDTNEIEEHEVTVDPNTHLASFETNHFSTYTLTLNPVQATSNPQTSDNLMSSIIMLVISIIVVSSLLVVNYCNKKVLN